jgi:hypothetical protein
MTWITKKKSTDGVATAGALLEAISKMSFGPMPLLVPRFKSSKYRSIPPV